MFKKWKFSKLLQHGLSIATVLVDQNHIIRSCNNRFSDWFGAKINGKSSKLIGEDFYAVLGHPEVLDGRYAPFYAATHEKNASAVERRSILKVSLPHAANSEMRTRTYEMLVTSKLVNSQLYFIVELRDLSKSSLFALMHDTLREAGNELTELIEREFTKCSYEQLVAMLAEKIREHMEKTLKRDVCEIRTIDYSRPGRELLPFINFGIDERGAQRTLVASATGDNGITGYVADTGNAYVCKDTHNDPYYLEGAINARSSLTVPLIYRNQIIGVCNVESLEPNDFSTHDVVFLQLYAKDLAQAIHMIDSYRQRNVTERHSCGTLMREQLDVELTQTFEEGCSLRRELEVFASRLCSSDPQIQSIAELQTHLDSFLKKISRDKQKSTDLSASFLSLSEELAKPKPARKEYSFLIPRNLFIRQCIGAQPCDYDSVCDFLKGARCLVVNKRMDDWEREERWEAFLAHYGAYVDIFSSASNAFEAATLLDYDLILANKFCDCQYFNNVTRDQAAVVQSQPFKPTDYDIHSEGYFEATNIPPKSLALRQKVLELTESGEKDDAYFFYRRLASRLLKDRRQLPIIVLSKPHTANPYDATHIQPSMTELRRSLFKSRAVQSEVQFFPDSQYPYLPLFCALYKELTQTQKLPTTRQENR